MTSNESDYGVDWFVETGRLVKSDGLNSGSSGVALKFSNHKAPGLHRLGILELPKEFTSLNIVCIPLLCKARSPAILERILGTPDGRS